MLDMFETRQKRVVFFLSLFLVRMFIFSSSHSRSPSLSHAVAVSRALHFRVVV